MKIPQKLSDFLMELAKLWALKQKNPGFNKDYQKVKKETRPL